MKHDLVIKGGTLVTASETFIADIGINGEKIVTLGESLDGYGLGLINLLIAL